MKFDVFNLKREKTGEIDLNDQVFGAEVKEQLFYDVVKAQLASRRAGTQSAKTRSEVAGSTKKLYKQKGTGNARHGSIRAPIYRGGGRAHPPTPRDWSYRPPRQMRVGALKSALSLLAKEGRLLIVDAMKLDEIRTKGLVTALKALTATDKAAEKAAKASSALLVDGKDNESLRLSARNLPTATVLPPEGVNVYDILRHDFLVLSQDAAKALEARCLR